MNRLFSKLFLGFFSIGLLLTQSVVAKADTLDDMLRLFTSMSAQKQREAARGVVGRLHAENPWTKIEYRVNDHFSMATDLCGEENETTTEACQTATSQCAFPFRHYFAQKIWGFENEPNCMYGRKISSSFEIYARYCREDYLDQIQDLNEIRQTRPDLTALVDAKEAACHPRVYIDSVNPPNALARPASVGTID